VHDKEVRFQVANSKPKEGFTKDRVGGVGLANTKKRLALLYPNKQHGLIINDTEDLFKVDLKITLS